MFDQFNDGLFIQEGAGVFLANDTFVCITFAIADTKLLLDCNRLHERVRGAFNRCV